jgi:hypothetical protein
MDRHFYFNEMRRRLFYPEPGEQPMSDEEYARIKDLVLTENEANQQEKEEKGA